MCCSRVVFKAGGEARFDFAAKMLPYKYTILNLLVSVCLISVVCGEGTKRVKRQNVVTELKRGLTNSEIVKILRFHNTMRSTVNPSATNMRMMTWNDDLAVLAQTYSCRCRDYHSSNTERSSSPFGLVGENLWVGGAWAAGQPELAVNSWFAERTDFTFIPLSCKEGRQCGHYTQAIWARSNLVGCGITECPTVFGPSSSMNRGHGFVFVCQYAPIGNYAMTPPYWTGRICSNCETGFLGGCVTNLCTPTTTCNGVACINGGTQRPREQCVCSCPTGYVGATCKQTLEQQKKACDNLTPLPRPRRSSGTTDRPGVSTALLGASICCLLGAIITA